MEIVSYICETVSVWRHRNEEIIDYPVRIKKAKPLLNYGVFFLKYIAMDSKICKHCNELKPLDLFTSSKKNKSGKCSMCKKCNCKRGKKYRLENIQFIKDINKKYALENKEKLKEYYFKYRLENKEKITEKRRSIGYDKKYRADINDTYIKRQLIAQGFKTFEITPELIELKRVIIKTIRLCQQKSALTVKNRS